MHHNALTHSFLAGLLALASVPALTSANPLDLARRQDTAATGDSTNPTGTTTDPSPVSPVDPSAPTVALPGGKFCTIGPVLTDCSGLSFSMDCGGKDNPVGPLPGGLDCGTTGNTPGSSTAVEPASQITLTDGTTCVISQEITNCDGLSFSMDCGGAVTPVGPLPNGQAPCEEGSTKRSARSRRSL